MKKPSGEIKIHWSLYEPYAGEVVRFEAPIGDQFFIMELDRCTEDYDGDDLFIGWNVVQCIVDEVTDKAIYTIDETISTGRAPMLTYGLAKTALAKLIKFMREEYDEAYCSGKVFHSLYADGADERRHSIYGRVLKKMGWIECEWDGIPCYNYVVEGRHE